MKVIKKDILEDIKDVPTVILHGCNCFHTMGAGIAKYLARRFPRIREADKATPYGDIAKLGTFSKVEYGNITIYNCYTQYRYGRKDPFVDYTAVARSLRAVRSDLLEQYRSLSEVDIRSPKIGCGLAGGDWSLMELIFDVCLPEATIYTL